MKERFLSKLIVDNNIIADRNKFSESLQEYLVNHWNDASISESEKAYTSQKLSELESDIASALPSSTANYIIVAVTNDDDENGTNLLTAYAAAKLLTPNGAALSATNRATVIVPPGVYKLSVQLNVDTEFIDIVSLTGNRDVYLTTNTIRVSVNDVKVKGVDVGTQVFKIKGGLTGCIIENCKGGDLSFGTDDDENETNADAYKAMCTFIDCVGGATSFGSYEAGGTFINCTATFYSFGSGSVASGVFKNCEGDLGSFGETITGQLYFCILKGSAFQTPTGTGAIYGSVDSTGFKAEEVSSD